MITLELEKDESAATQYHHWNMVLIDHEENRRKNIASLKLTPSSITNKFDIIKDTFSDVSRNVPRFVPWFVKLIKKYKESGYNSELVLDEVPMFLEISQEYIDSKDIPFDSFVDLSKASKTSIIFKVPDIKQLALTSMCLKLYSIFCYDNEMRPTDNVHKLIYSGFIQGCQDVGTVSKIYQTMKSRTYRSSITDRYMWDLIKMMVVETPESYTLLLFNFLMNNLLVTVDITSNPIPYFVSVTDKSIDWMMRSIYKDKVIYGEAFGGSDDIYGSSVTKENLHILCCNDVIGKAAAAGMAVLEEEYQIDDEEFIAIRDRLDKLNILSVSMKCVILPIASKVLEIPYNYLLAAPPKHIMLIGILLYHCSRDNLDSRFPVIAEFLSACPTNVNSVVTRSSYKIKGLELVLNNKTDKPFGFASGSLRFDILSCICGILTASKKDLVSLLSGKRLNKINYSDLESDVIFFFSELYSNKLDPMFDKMRNAVDTYF